MMLQQQGGGGGIGSSGESVAAAEGREHGGLNEEEKGRSEESERNSGGSSRWPRQETIALLKIRADMDVAFRDSSLKGPLWDEVSRKLSELGYHRSAKKCKEKFENVYKYHKRTKDGRNTKADGKTYRFFEQLEALDHNHPSLSLMSWSPMKQHKASHQIITSTMVANNMDITSPVVTNVTVSSTPSPISTVFPSNAIHPINLSSINISSQPTVTISPSNIPTKKPTGIISTDHDLAPAYNHNPNMSFLSNSTSSTSSDERPERYGKRKRKWEDFFGRLMSEVIQKQDELQKKFLETLEKRERDRIAREEAWRVQEIAKMNREHERLLQERSMAAAKDAAVISFLQKITEQQHHQQISHNNPISVPQILNQMQAQAITQTPPVVAPPPPVVQVSQPEPPPAVVTAPAQAHTQTPTQVNKRDDMINQQSSNYNGGVDNAMLMSPSPSRWPKAEIQALINFRTTLDTKYHETGPKGPLWEEISAAMRKIGYNRNAKRCKEKWENINKYYKKVKESNKKRPEDAKTCPYFHQLEALYKEKAKTEVVSTSNIDNAINSIPLAAVPIMAQPEQQWPLQEKHKNLEHDNDNLDDPNMNDDDYENDDDEDEDDGGAYEIVPNKQQQQTAEMVGAS